MENKHPTKYQSTYTAHAAFLRKHPAFLRFLLFMNKALTLLFMFAFVAIGAYGVILQAKEKAFDGWELVVLFGAPLACLALVALLRFLFPRRRPYNPNGAGIVPFLEKKMDEKSFPSRHLASAFVIATVICAVSPIAGVVLYMGGLFLGYIRFALGLHYPTDLIGGGILGFLCGLCAFFIL